MAVQRVRVGVVGCGMGSLHAEAYRRLETAELVAICDHSESKFTHCQHQWSVPSAYTRYEDMFAQPDLEAVTIALPTHLHAAATTAALSAGKHVLVEKPMALDAAQAEQMAEVARTNGRVLMVSYNQRFDADAQYLKRCIDEGLLGDIYFVRAVWRRPMSLPPGPTTQHAAGAYKTNWRQEADKGGAARDLGSHAIDLALWLMGFPEIRDVVGRAYAPFAAELTKRQGFLCDADDHSVGFVRFKNGASLQVEVSYRQHTGKKEIMTEVFGTKGGAVRIMGQPLQLFGAVAGAYTTAIPVLPSESSASPQQAFIDSILSGEAPLVTAEQGITVMRVLDQMRSG